MNDFELFQTIKNGKKVWCFLYHDEDGKRHNKTCKKCKTRQDALVFLKKFKKCFVSNNCYLIKNIAADMYLSESEHMKRLEKFGKHICEKTISQKRYFIELIIKEFGNKELNHLSIAEIENRLLKDEIHSGSWKNFYLETFGNIYDESIWKCTIPVPKPKFQRFTRNSRKSDIFTNNELDTIFNKKLWCSETEWLLFSLAKDCGLRLGEARAVQVRQIKFSLGVLIVDGFLRYDGFRTNFNKKGNNNDRKIRVVPIPDSLLRNLALYFSKKNLKDDNFVFTRDGEIPFTNRHLERTLEKVLQKSSINYTGRRLTPHSLRYTYVTKMRTKMNVEDVRNLVGHTTTEMTDYYTRSSIEDLTLFAQTKKDIVNELFENKNKPE